MKEEGARDVSPASTGEGYVSGPCVVTGSAYDDSARRRDARHVDLLSVRDDEVEDLHARFVDVVFERLGLAIQDGVADESDDRDDEAEGGTVHRLRDSLGENARLLARIHALAGDRAE